MKELLIPMVIMVVFVGFWSLKLEKIVRKVLKNHLMKQFKNGKAVFIDPR